MLRSREPELPLHLEAHGALVRLVLRTEFSVIMGVEPEIVREAERGGSARVRAITALPDTLHADGLKAGDAHRHRAEILMDVVDEFSIGRQVEDLSIDDEVMP